MKFGKMRVFTLSLVLTLMGGLLLATTAVVSAQNNDENQGRRGVYGEVVTISEDGTMTVMTKSGTEVIVDMNTTDLDIVVGNRVALLVNPAGDGQPSAIISGLIRPEQPQFEHLSGAVVSKSATSMTIIDGTGREHIVSIPEGVQISVSPGDLATVVTSGGLGENGGGAPAVVHGGVSAQNIADRMKDHAVTIRAQAQAGEVSTRTAEERVTFIQELLNDLTFRVNATFADVLNRIPGQAQDAVQTAMDNAVLGFQNAQADVAPGSVAPDGRPDDAGQPTNSSSGQPENPGRSDGTPGGNS